MASTSSDSLIIKANFSPAKNPRAMMILTKLGVILLAVLMLGALVLYGLNVSLSAHINQYGRKTRELNESNKELQVELQRARSFQNIAQSAARISSLKPATDIIEVSLPKQTLLPKLPNRQGERPRVYGY